MTTLRVGDTAPDFTSVTQDGQPFTKANPHGTTHDTLFLSQGQHFGMHARSQEPARRQGRTGGHGVRIVGVSPDSERSHRNFCAKHELNFTLLADTDHSVCEAFGVWAEKSMYGRKYMGVLRTTFVIDAEGRIEKIFTKVDTKNHYRQIADAYKQAE